jgi:hypothetical protein
VRHNDMSNPLNGRSYCNRRIVAQGYEYGAGSFF